MDSLNPYHPPQHVDQTEGSDEKPIQTRRLVWWIVAAAVLQCCLTILVMMVEFGTITIGIDQLPLYQLITTSAAIVIVSLVMHLRVNLKTAAWATQVINITQWATFLGTVLIILNGMHLFGSNHNWTWNDTKIMATTVFSLAGAIALMSGVKWLCRTK